MWLYVLAVHFYCLFHGVTLWEYTLTNSLLLTSSFQIGAHQRSCYKPEHVSCLHVYVSPSHTPCQATAVTLVEFPKHLKGKGGAFLFGCFLFIPSWFQRLHHASLTILAWDKANIVVENTVEQSFPLLGGQEVEDGEAGAATCSLQPYTAFYYSLLGCEPSAHYVVDVTSDPGTSQSLLHLGAKPLAHEHLRLPCPNHKICPTFR